MKKTMSGGRSEKFWEVFVADSLAVMCEAAAQESAANGALVYAAYTGACAAMMAKTDRGRRVRKTKKTTNRATRVAL